MVRRVTYRVLEFHVATGMIDVTMVLDRNRLPVDTEHMSTREFFLLDIMYGLCVRLGSVAVC